jgi:hypothetical protein
MDGMRIGTMAAAVAVAAAVAMTSLATASASPGIARLGDTQTHVDETDDSDGTVNTATVTAYTVSNLQPSNDVVNVPLGGKLWEATVAVSIAPGGFPAVVLGQLVEVVIPCFIARSAGGDNYRALNQVNTPNSLDPVVPPSGPTTGKIYFDVTGPPPTEVVFNNFFQDLLVWN